MISFYGSWLTTNSLRPRKLTAYERLGRGIADADGGGELERRLEEVGQKVEATTVRAKPVSCHWTKPLRGRAEGECVFGLSGQLQSRYRGR